LEETDYPWKLGETYLLSLQVQGNHLQAFIGDKPIFDVEDTINPFLSGGIALICEDGCMSTWQIKVGPIKQSEDSPASLGDRR
jgi:hypothetical protein